MDASDARALRDMGRRALESSAAAARSAVPSGMSRVRARVTKDNGDGTLNVDTGSTAHPEPLLGVRMTTGCRGVAVGDIVLVETMNHISYVTGVIANSNASKVEIPRGMGFTQKIYGTQGSTGQWMKLGTYNSANDSPGTCVIRVYSGNGWNANGNTQNSWFQIHIKDSHDPDGYYGVLVELHNCRTTDIAVQVRAASHSQCDVWVQFKTWSYWGGYYSVECAHDWTPGPGNSSQSSAPTGGTLCTTHYETEMPVEKIYPVGAVYISYVSTSPASLFGGTWTPITGRFPYFNAGTGTGGSNTHTLLTGEIPAHSHTLHGHTWNWGAQSGSGTKLGVADTGNVYQGAPFTSNGLSTIQGTYGGTQNSGGGGSHNNMPAYQTLYAWRRTA